MVRCALALNLDENGEIGGSLTVPRLEWLELLETIALRVDDNLYGGAVLRRCLEGVLAGVVSARRELIAGGVRELEGLAVRSSKGVSERVEGQVASEREGSDDIGRCNEGVRSRVGVITAGEISVV